MNVKKTPEQQVVRKIQKRLQKIIKTYEKVILKLEIQLDKVNRLEEQEEVITVRETIRTGLVQSRKFLEKARKDYQQIAVKQDESFYTDQ